MSGSMEPVLAAISELGSRFSRLETGFDRLETGFDRLETRFDRLDTRIDQLDTRIDQLSTRVERFETRFDRLEEAVTQLRVDSMERMDRQQDMLTSIRDDIAVNMAATVRTQKANGEVRQDMLQLSEQVSLIHRRLIQLEERVDRSELRS